jgi:hypothetical protein
MRRWLGTRGAGVVVALLLAACGGAPVSIPADAQQVRVTSQGDVVRLAPSSVEAGEVWFAFDADPETQHVGVTFVHRGRSPDEPPAPLSDEDVELLRADANPDVPGFGYEGGFGGVMRYDLAPGLYVFLIQAPNLEGDVEPDDPPISLAVLEVRP